MDIQTQLDLFTQAVHALGGSRSAARALNVTERTISRLLSGESRIHAGILEDMAKALIAHADRCRRLEQQLHPAFGANRTQAQATPPKHRGNADRRRPKADRDQINAVAARLGLPKLDT